MAYDPLLAKPGDLSPLDRILGDAKRPSKRVPLPGWLGEGGSVVALWILRDGELAQARAAAQRFILDELKLDALKLALDDEVYREELERQTLAVALRDPANPEFPFASASALRRGLDPDLRRCLLQAYEDFKAERAPDLAAVDAEKVQELVAALGKERASSAFASYYDRATLVRIVLALSAGSTRPTTESSSSTGPSS